MNQNKTLHTIQQQCCRDLWEILFVNWLLRYEQFPIDTKDMSLEVKWNALHARLFLGTSLDPVGWFHYKNTNFVDRFQ